MPRNTSDRLDVAVTAGGGHLITFADGHCISVFGQPGVTVFDEVFLHPGLDVDWDHAEDRWELLQSGDPKLAEGRLFQEVPVADVRALVDEHGGIKELP